MNKEQFKYKRCKRTINIVWDTVTTTGTIVVPIDSLQANIYTENGLETIPIEDTPHYHWIIDLIKGNDDTKSRMGYYNYLNDFFPDADTDFYVNSTENMVKAFRIESLDTVVVSPELIIHDGLHRLSIAKALNYKTVKCNIMQNKRSIIKRIYHRLKKL